jgi:DNA modification methylase
MSDSCTGRNFIGIEKDPAYFAVAERRREAEAQLGKAA